MNQDPKHSMEENGCSSFNEGNDESDEDMIGAPKEIADEHISIGVAFHMMDTNMKETLDTVEDTNAVAGPSGCRPGKETLFCNFCQKEFAEDFDFDHHYYQTHGVEDLLVCHVSERGLSQLEDLKHVESHTYDTDSQVNNSNGKMVTIANNGRDSSEDSNATVGPFGILQHSKEKTYFCNLCPKKFSRLWDLNLHHKTHTGETPFVCEVCNKEFRQKGDGDRHKKAHTNEKPFVCYVCQKKFSWKWLLDLHYRTHNGEKPFVCDICNKGFAQKGNLNRHYRTHTSEKPFVCDVCQKEFSQKTHLNVHYRTHTGEKPFVCEVCKKGFAHRNRLTSHVLTHKRDKSFTCNVCGKVYTSDVYLKNHYKAKHA